MIHESGGVGGRGGLFACVDCQLLQLGVKDPLSVLKSRRCTFVSRSPSCCFSACERVYGPYVGCIRWCIWKSFLELYVFPLLSEKRWRLSKRYDRETERKRHRCSVNYSETSDFTIYCYPSVLQYKLQGVLQHKLQGGITELIPLNLMSKWATAADTQYLPAHVIQ